jgi:FAD/FMN-containing dehydrogenase
MRNRCREVRDAANAEERNRLWEGRRGAFGAVARLAPNYLVNDCTVPRTRLPEALAQVAAIVARHGFEHGNVFHAGDGNLHPLILFDSRDPDQMKHVHEAGWEIMVACVGLGGTISGEHGIGVEKLEAMRLVFSDDDLDVQRSLQTAFDSDRVLNPGKMFPDTRRSFASKEHAIWATAGWAPTAAEHAMAASVKQALDEGHGLVPVGSGHMGDFGNASARPLTPLKTDSLSAMLDLDPANQVVTAGAGMAIGAVQEALAPHNQWLPLRPPYTLMQRTMGGITALGACGPERTAYGAPRKLLLGLKFIDGRGRLINAGGKVVKNVAGYDLTRLVAGSAGTLGIITRVTMRTATRPERCAALAAVAGLQECARLATVVLGSSLGAAFATAEPDEGADRWRLRFGFEGFEMTVASQLSHAQTLLEQAGFSDPRAEDYDVVAGPFGGIYRRIDGRSFVLRAGVASDRLVQAVAALNQPSRMEVALVDFGCGRLLAGYSAMTDDAWQAIGKSVSVLAGHATLEKAPDEFKQRNDVYGPPRPEWKLMHRIKEILDPQRVFAAGRMPGRV